MNCSYGPYEISSELEAVGEFSFIDSSLSRQIAVSSQCDETVNIPCVDATVLHVEDSCPDGCKMFWYDCPSEMGRKYTILPTPCGVKITSFEDGLISVENCDATLYGSELFCFGKVYTSAGEFDSPDKSSTTFDFENHTFTVKGNLGVCNELYNCPECQITSQLVTAFEDLPTPPDEFSSPESTVEEEDVLDVDTTETEVIPAEGRTQWPTDPTDDENWTPTEFKTDVLCEGEKPLSTAATSTGTSLPVDPPCASSDNPCITTLPSGHTVIAYENRREDGLTKISVAILSSSVRNSIRYHRNLGTGTLLNDISEADGATFIVYEELSISFNDKKIGFLNGPASGSFFPITAMNRIVDGDVIRHEFKLDVIVDDVVFPDKNHAYNIEWFIVDNDGNADLPAGNTMSILDLPHHLDPNSQEVPVSNPSIAVAQNNLMVSDEQNIYIAYQAFEENEWRIYLREIIIGSGSSAPAYIAPYTFDSEDIRQIQIMSAEMPSVSLMQAGDITEKVLLDEDFSAFTQGGVYADGFPTDWFDIAHPRWDWLDDTTWETYTSEFFLSSEILRHPGHTGLPQSQCSTGSSCAISFNVRYIPEDNLGEDDSPLLRHHTSSFIVGDASNNVLNGTEDNQVDLSFRLRFHIVLNVSSEPSEASYNDRLVKEYPEIWFLIGYPVSGLTPPRSIHKASFRIQIRRGKNLKHSSMEPAISCDDGVFHPDCSAPGNECFIFSLYKTTSPKGEGNQDSWNDRNATNGTQQDLPTRSRSVCISAGQIGNPGDYSFLDWNEWRVNTYIRGFYRFFDIYLTHPDGTEVFMTTFREIEESIHPLFDGTAYNMNHLHGFGVVQSGQGNNISTLEYAKHQVLIDNYSVKTIGRPASDKIYFYEDWLEHDSSLADLDFANAPAAVSPFISGSGLTVPNSGAFYYDSLVPRYCSVGREGEDQVPGGDRFYDQFVKPPIKQAVIYPSLLSNMCRIGGINGQPDAGGASFVNIRVIAADMKLADDVSFGNPLHTSVSMVVSVNAAFRDSWPHIWFLGRIQDSDNSSVWADRYRLRISRFTCQNDYSIGPGLLRDDKVWRLQAYNSGIGDMADVPAAESFLKIGTGPTFDTEIEWQRHLPDGGGGNTGDGHRFRELWNYFKIDMYDVAGDRVGFDVYVGYDRPANAADPGVHPDDINFELLDTLIIDAIPPGPFDDIYKYFGLVLFTGHIDESPDGLTGDDYRSNIALNYISLSTIGEPVVTTGACCRASGGCEEDVNPANCTGSDIWKTGSCINANCSGDLPIGAGCNEGICIGEITEQEAIDQGVEAWIEGKNCDSCHPDFRNCSVSTTIGRCCSPSGCIETTLALCQGAWGVDPVLDFIPGAICGTNPCNTFNVGACCAPSGCHMVVSSIECDAFGGIFQGFGTDCLSAGCGTGACCDGVGGCTQTDQETCCSEGSSFLGIGILCAPDPCSPAPDIGACCFDDGECNSLTESGCTSGTFFYDSLCGDIGFSCPVITGACCDPFTGKCDENIIKSDCLNAGKTFSEGQLCSYVDCPQPPGACCDGLLCLNDKTQQECQDLNGNYLGNFSRCLAGENVCEGIGSDAEDPYGFISTTITYKPEDLWTIGTASEEYVTRILYHMREQINDIALSSDGRSIDFMLLLDHSGSMVNQMHLIADAMPEFVSDMTSKGLDVRIGYTWFGRDTGIFPVPSGAVTCDCNFDFLYMANGLQRVSRCQDGNAESLEGSNENGFTRNIAYLQKALSCWGTQGNWTSPWSAIQFAIEDPQFEWRTSAAKYMLLVTAHDPFDQCAACGTWSTDVTDAQNSLRNNDVTLIPVLNSLNTTLYEETSLISGWGGGTFDFPEGDYSSVFASITNTIVNLLHVTHASIIERAASGTEATFLKKGEVIITYDGDLSDLWTFNKEDFEFNETHVPFNGTSTKQLLNFPFSLSTEKIYGIDPVHVQGNPSNWISFGVEGALLYDYPNVGSRASGRSSTPLLISANSAHPKVFVNNRNQVMVAYENYSGGIPQINIKGTGDFHQNSITGPKANRIVRMLNLGDFSYSHAITLPGEGINQLCDFVIDNSDITHITWQSNRDGNWEIYYANSSNLFDPVRITKAISRSSSPSIDVEENGSIFIVYHDDRFGPFDIMLSSKDEERIIPLLEQDAYLASLRNKYAHYTNIIPVFLDYPVEPQPTSGSLWGAKTSDGPGNDSENFIYLLNETTGIPNETVGFLGDSFDLEDLKPEKIALSFSSGEMFSVHVDNLDLVVTNLGRINASETLDLNSRVVGTVPMTEFGTRGTGGDFVNPVVQITLFDIAIDGFGRIWVFVVRELENGNKRMITLALSPFDASIIAFSQDLGGSSTSLSPGFTYTMDFAFNNDFWYIRKSNTANQAQLRSSPYPVFGVVQQLGFTFTDHNQYGSSFDPVSMTFDASGNLLVIDSSNDLYKIEKDEAASPPDQYPMTFQTSLTTSSGEELVRPVGTTSGITFQFKDLVPTESSEFFHIRIDFYDNIALEGDAFLSIDSRSNLEAFINEEVSDDPYVVSGMDSRGMLLNPNEIGIVFFDVSHFVPGFSKLSQPYNFEPNQTYFPRVFVIDQDDNVRESKVAQPNSFSCSKCSRFSNNNFNSSSCSYSFVMNNEEAGTQDFNFQIDFYADAGKQHIIRRFEAIPGSADLQYMEVDNDPATGKWGEFGLSIAGGNSAFVQIYPTLDPTAGFLCGVDYEVQVNECHAVGNTCIDFSIITPSKWFSVLLGEDERIQDDILGTGNNVSSMGLSMKVINDKLCVAWRDSDDNLKFSQFDGENWSTQLVVSTDKTIYCDLEEVNGLPTIAYVTLDGISSSETVISLKGNVWQEWTSMKSFLDFKLIHPRTLLEYNNAPMIAYYQHEVEGDGNGNPVFRLKDGQPTVIDVIGFVNASVRLIALATINGLPAVAWMDANSIKYATWNATTETFENEQTVATDANSQSSIALTEVDSQPAIAYRVRTIHNVKDSITYTRFNGSTWEAQKAVIVDGFLLFASISMTTVNGDPHIAYAFLAEANATIVTSVSIGHAFYNGSKFVSEIIDEYPNELKTFSYMEVNIAEYENAPVIVAGSNPFGVYFLRQQSPESTDEIGAKFFCECSSQIFGNRLTNINEISRWESSAHGFSDTAVTNSQKNSLLPVIKTRVSGTAIILWEDHNISDNCPNPPCVRAATFRNTNQDQLRGSGTKMWFDYDFGISGQDPDLAIDMLDRVNSIYEKPKSPGAVIHGHGVTKRELPGNDLYGKVCDFEIATSTAAGGTDTIDPEDCDLEGIKSNIISYDKFISDKIVRKIRVKDEFVQYYTYNAANTLTPIVSTCNITLEIHGTPEIVALRLRNENETSWRPWCPWSPQLSNFVMEKDHKISGITGVKEVCIQVMTYIGITTEFCLPIIADYETVVFDTRFYKNKDIEGNPVVGFSSLVGVDSDLFTENLDKTLIELPLADGISVASLIPAGDDFITILVEIVPNQEFDEAKITFDVIQQGINDKRGIQAFRGKNNDGRVLYRGEFTIEKEDKVFNTDGLARISPTFPSSCDNVGSTIVGTSSLYTRDSFNEPGEDLIVEPTEVTDPLQEFRQTTSGRIGVSLDIRSSEDPYFVFGDPNYSLKQTEGKHIGVPFKVAQTEIATGTADPQLPGSTGVVGS